MMHMTSKDFNEAKDVCTKEFEETEQVIPPTTVISDYRYAPCKVLSQRLTAEDNETIGAEQSESRQLGAE
jgi:hypothetical protein